MVKKNSVILFSGDLIYGIIPDSSSDSGSDVTDYLRQLTICWSRYGYRGQILEAANIDSLIELAFVNGAKYMFVQEYGTVLLDNWDPFAQQNYSFNQELIGWSEQHNLVVVRETEKGIYFINMDKYGRTGCQNINEISKNLISQLPPHLKDHVLVLKKDTADKLEQIRNSINDHDDRLSVDKAGKTGYESNRFLNSISRQISNARNGVFLWNIESCDDIEIPDKMPGQSLDSFYSVAAGFKPLWILKTYGIKPATRMVYFDYSQHALDIRKEMVSVWDGEDYPDFIRHIFDKFEDSGTFYQLWSDKSTDDVNDKNLENMWKEELARWGGRNKFKLFWRKYAQLPHEYIHCNLIEGSPELLETMQREDYSVIWFSNAFFTVFANILYSFDKRKEVYEDWIASLSRINPQMILYGSDYNNDNVNCLAIEDYWEKYQLISLSELIPAGLNTFEIRM